MLKQKMTIAFMGIMEFKIIGNQIINGEAGVLLKALDGVALAIIENLPNNATMVTLSAEATAMVFSSVVDNGYVVRVSSKHIKEVRYD